MKKLQAILLLILVSSAGSAFAAQGEAYGSLTMDIKIAGCKAFKINSKKIGEAFNRYFRWSDDGTWNYVDQVGDLRTDILLAELGNIGSNLGGTYSITKNKINLTPDSETEDYYASLVASFADEICNTNYLNPYGSTTGLYISYWKNQIVLNKRGTTAKLSSKAYVYLWAMRIAQLKETMKFTVAPGSFPTVNCSYSYYYGYSCY